jgi:hypothetical protein
MTGLPEKIVTLHHSLDDAGLPHAFGGALALAWCTERARGTIDIDVNVFIDVARTRELLAALPERVAWSEDDVVVIERDGQARLWWGTTPVDVFLSTTEFHDQLAGRFRVERFEGADVPFLSCSDLAVFKAFFNRTKDWADLEEMLAVGTLDSDRVVGVLTRYLGPNDERIVRLLRLSE